MKARILALSSVVWLLLAAGCVCVAADFSADSYMSGMGTKTLKKVGKLYASGKMIRQEMTAGSKRHIIILRADKHVAYAINPTEKQYVEMPVTQKGMDDPRSDVTFAQGATKKKLGTETVNGYACEKTQYTKGKPSQTATRWYSKKLDWPIKTQLNLADGRNIVQEFKNIKVGKQPMSLFEVPKGYKKVAPPKMPMPQQAPPKPNK